MVGFTSTNFLHTLDWISTHKNQAREEQILRARECKGRLGFFQGKNGMFYYVLGFVCKTSFYTQTLDPLSETLMGPTQ